MTPGFCNPLFPAGNVSRVEFSFVEWPVDDHRIESRVDNELGDRWITTNVSFRSGEELICRNFTKNVSQVEIAVDHLLDLQVADFTQISLIAFRHDGNSPLE